MYFKNRSVAVIVSSYLDDVIFYGYGKGSL